VSAGPAYGDPAAAPSITARAPSIAVRDGAAAALSIAACDGLFHVAANFATCSSKV
jgi:hypothetical protein